LFTEYCNVTLASSEYTGDTYERTPGYIHIVPDTTCTHCINTTYNVRGISTVVLDPANCTFVSPSYIFDTYNSSDQANKFEDYLASLNNTGKVLLGVSTDSAVSTKNENNHSNIVSNSLNKYGVNVTSLVNHEKFAFVIQFGTLVKSNVSREKRTNNRSSLVVDTHLNKGSNSS